MYACIFKFKNNTSKFVVFSHLVLKTVNMPNKLILKFFKMLHL